ncbi:MAG: glycosyltransferase [Candidatus Omnitrophica bacterium]|nr:glycosyltransferase [Candidatus Omnitrophota bacterium]MCM8791035.1 glycosyltransferase [Candidatus Omnitrophota bacterium]
MCRHVVFAGLNYQPEKSSGDKNFWSDAIRLIASGLDRVSIISVRKHHLEREELFVGKCRVTIDYILPQLVETPDVHYRRRIFWREGAFPLLWGIVEKTISAHRIMKKLGSLYAEEPFSHVHLMDNFGPSNRGLLKTINKLGAGMSVSAIAHQGRNPFLYHPYLKLSYDLSGASIVAYSRAFADWLVKFGLNDRSVKHIPWGVSPERIGTVGDKASSKEKAGLPADRPLFVWAGYIQQVQRQDFLFLLDCARRALAKGLKATIYFAFKPETFESSFRAFDEPAAGIYVRPTAKDFFDTLKQASDVFLSPILNKNCIIAPPLTWIEFMSIGVPIITTDVPGSGEIIEDGKTGYIVDEHNLVDKMFAIAYAHDSFKENCIRKIREDYNMQDIARRYLELFSKNG